MYFVETFHSRKDYVAYDQSPEVSVTSEIVTPFGAYALRFGFYDSRLTGGSLCPRMRTQHVTWHYFRLFLH